MTPNAKRSLLAKPSVISAPLNPLESPYQLQETASSSKLAIAHRLLACRIYAWRCRATAQAERGGAGGAGTVRHCSSIVV